MSFDEELRDLLDGSVAEALAASEVEIAQLHLAIKSRTRIGQATGMLMLLLDVGEDQALDYLRRLSSHTNRKLTELAEEVVATRALPDVEH
ncbi:MAG TPA: ANTAR domain-containing protein [Nocardioides sp.]|nr:ANTAR domain-containing protein [Nocardioides sp.]